MDEIGLDHHYAEHPGDYTWITGMSTPLLHSRSITKCSMRRRVIAPLAETAMFQAMYFEEYETGAERTTLGRTITETDIVIHAGQTGDFYPHHMDAEWCKTRKSGSGLRMGR